MTDDDEIRVIPDPRPGPDGTVILERDAAEYLAHLLADASRILGAELWAELAPLNLLPFVDSKIDLDQRRLEVWQDLDECGLLPMNLEDTSNVIRAALGALPLPDWSPDAPRLDWFHGLNGNVIYENADDPTAVDFPDDEA